jgi:hypothetical protein
MRERLQPSSETPRRIIGECRHQPVELQEHNLGHILGVGLLESPPMTPLEDLGTVSRDEILPGRLVVRVSAETPQQSHAGPRRVVLRHRDHLRETLNLSQPRPNASLYDLSITKIKTKKTNSTGLGF